MFGALRWLAGKVATYWDVITGILSWIIPALGGVLSAWGAWAAGIFSQYAPFSWIAAGLLGALVGALFAAAVAFARIKFVEAAAVARWSKQVDDVNPLDEQFHRRRIKLSEMAHPFTGRIVRKTFNHCEILGPCILAPQGDVTMMDVAFMDCSVVVVRPDRPIHSAVFLEQCKVIGGSMTHVTILISEDAVPVFKKMGGSAGVSKFLTYTGDPEIDGVPQRQRQ